MSLMFVLFGEKVLRPIIFCRSFGGHCCVLQGCQSAGGLQGVAGGARPGGELS